MTTRKTTIKADSHEQGAALAPPTGEVLPVTGADLVLLAPPPVTANIPAPPRGFVPSNAGISRGILPRKSELAALPIAVIDLGKFTTYSQTLGATVSSYNVALQAFTVANQWSSMRTQATAWDLYCQQQEGIAWKTIRAQMVRLRVAFALAVAGDPTVAAAYPGLAALLGAKQAIAAKAISTRQANKKALAEGKSPTHGAVGKKRQRAAAKAALAAAEAAARAQAPAQTQVPTQTQLPTPTPTPTQAQAQAPAPTTTPATPAPVNGAHS